MASSSDLLDMENVFSQPVASKTLARWERKQQGGSSSTSSKVSSKQKTPSTYDRFISSRPDTKNSLHKFSNECNNENVNLGGEDRAQGAFQNQLAQSLFEGDDINSKVLAFKAKAPKPTETFQNNLRVLYTQNKNYQPVKRTRYISSTPERVLDAPNLMDDYYLNVLDWAPTNVLAIALGSCVYLWDAATGNIEELCEAKDDAYIASVNWMIDGSHLALGLSTGEVQMWDVARKKQIRSMKGHSARVGSLSWNNHILSSGSRDSMIFHHDVRIAQHHVKTLKGHQQEICGLKWSPDGTQLASGGNDNMCCIWDANAANDRALHTMTEANAAVKALAWNPAEPGLLATGCGTADRHIRFYNTMTGSVVNEIDTESQVCSLIWAKDGKELLSSHGFSQNQLTVWKYPTMVKVAELTGHTSRVLQTALSSDGQTVCSAAADETIRFWNVFEVAAKKSRKTAGSPGQSSRLRMNIR